MKIKRIILHLPLLFMIFLSAPALAAEDPGPGGVRERAGGVIPLGLEFTDETGGTVRLKEVMDVPTILFFAYYRCANLCAGIASNMAGVIGRMPSEPGRDFRVVTVSFDETDTPSDAMRKKTSYTKAAKRPVPEGGWRFFTGSAASIKALSGAVGFDYIRQRDGFIHPGFAVVISPEGKIIRYLYGESYLPFDMEMAIKEASAGRTGPTIPKALLFCYRNTPLARLYVSGTLKAAGAATIALSTVFFIYIRKRNSARTGDR